MSLTTSTGSKTKRFGRHSFSIPNPFSRQSVQEKEDRQLQPVEEVTEAGQAPLVSGRRASLQLGGRDSSPSSPARGEKTIKSHGLTASPSFKPASGLTRSKTIAIPRSTPDSHRLTASTTSTTLKSKVGSSSGLPKYRPRSSANTSSHLTVSGNSIRKRSSAGDDLERNGQESLEADDSSSVASPAHRPISPLPRRAILRAINSGNIHSKSPPNASLLSTKSTTIALSPTHSDPRTRRRRSHAKTSPVIIRRSPAPKASPGKRTYPPTSIPVKSHIVCNDQDEEDVSFLLGAVVSPSKPTPSIPRSYSRDTAGHPHSFKRDHDPDVQDPVREDPFLSPSSTSRSFESTIKTPTLTRIHLEMQTPGLLSKMTAPFGMTPDTDAKSVGPSPTASPVARHTNYYDRSPHVQSVDTSLDLSDREIQLSSGYSPDIRKTDEALTTLLKMQLATMEEQLEESKRRYDEVQSQFQTREHDLEGRLIDLASQHQLEMNAQRLVVESLQAQLEGKLKEDQTQKRSLMRLDYLEVAFAWQRAMETGDRELEVIRERRETLQLLLSSLNL